MENKKQTIELLNWLISEYQDALDMCYVEIRSRNMETGVCNKIKSYPYMYQGIDIISIGNKYVNENKRHLKKLFPICFKKSSFNMKSYWCNLTPSISYTAEQMEKSLELRLYVLRQIMSKITSL